MFRGGTQEARSPGRLVSRNENLLVHCRNDFGGFELKVTCEIHNEAVALTYMLMPKPSFFKLVADLQRMDTESTEFEQLFESNQNELKELASILEKLVSKTGDNGKPFGQVLSKSNADSTLKELYEHPWNFVDKMLITHVTHLKNSCDLIGDFKGIVLNSSPASQLREQESRRPKSGVRVLGDFPITWSHPRANDITLIGEDVHGMFYNKDADPIEPRKKFGAVLLNRNLNYVTERSDLFAAIMNCGKSSKIGLPPQDGNTAFCGFMDGIALYGSSLRQPSENSIINEAWYFLVQGGPSRFQLGRLLMRLHRAGLARLLALLDHSDLRAVARSIRQVSLKLESKLNGFATPDVDSEASLREAEIEIARFMKHGRGGYKFRSSRTLFYGAQLKETLDDLRAITIPGWQTYPDFLGRHVLSEVRNLSTTFQQMSQLEERIRRLQAFRTTQGLSDASKASEKLMEDLKQNSQTSTETMKSLLAATVTLNANEAQIVNLQETAEYIAICAGTYYIASTLSYGLKAIFDESKVFGIASYEAIWPVAILIGSAFLVTKFSKKMEFKFEFWLSKLPFWNKKKEAAPPPEVTVDTGKLARDQPTSSQTSPSQSGPN